MDESDFDVFLDESYEPVHIADLVLMPSEVIKECDPTAYREMYNNWLDWVESDSE